MNCMEIQELMELYYKGELDEATMDGIDEHLEHCESCLNHYNYLEKTISEVKDMYADIELPKELDNIDDLIPKKPKKKKSLYKKAVAAVSIIIIAGVLVNSNALADTIKKIAYPEWASNIAGKSVTNSFDKGFGQSVELSDSKAGITMTVHNVIIEEDKTRVIFSLSGVSGGDNVSIGHVVIKDKRGKVLANEGGWGYTYNDKEGKVYVSYEGPKINKLPDELTFEVSDIKVLNNRKKEFDYSIASSSASDIKLNLDSKIYKNVNFKSIEQASSKLIVKYDIEFYDMKTYGSLTPYVNLEGGEKKLTSVYSGDSNKPQTSTATIEETYDLKEANPNSLKLQFHYYDIEKELSQAFKVSFKVDKSTINTSKIEKAIGRTLILGGSKITIDRLEATPSETRIIIKEANNANSNGNLSGTYLPELQLEYDNMLHTASRTPIQSSKENEYLYTFDPIDNFKDVKLKVNKAAQLSYCSEEIKLTGISEEKQKTKKIIDEVTFDIVYYRQNGALKVEIYSSDSDKGYLQDVSLGDIKTSIERQDLSYKESRFIITGSDFKEDSASLFIKAYTKITDPGVEINFGE